MGRSRQARQSLRTRELQLHEQFYAAWPDCTHFRPHPAGDNPTTLPEWRSWDKVWNAVVLNSSVAVDALIAGIGPNVVDHGGMAWGWHNWDEVSMERARLQFMRWLAWTQWSHDEIAEGLPIRHLFNGAA